MLQFFTEQCPWYVAGPLMGGTVVLFQWLSNYSLGMSGAIGEAKDCVKSPRKGRGWQLYVFFGVMLGALFYGVLTDSLHRSWDHGSFDRLVSGSFELKALVLLAGGVIVGFGTRMAGGCTSGNGLCGVGRASPASLAATGMFCGVAIIVTALINALFGGGL